MSSLCRLSVAKKNNFWQILTFWGLLYRPPFTDQGQIWRARATQGLHLQAKFHLNAFIVSASGGQKPQIWANFDIFGRSCTDPHLPHLGHIISATWDDKAAIMSKRNTYVSILIMFYVSSQVVTRLPDWSLWKLTALCSSFYGSVLWDLANASLHDVCIVWRKRLRRILQLPHNTHCNLLPLLCDTLPLMDELSCRRETARRTSYLDSQNCEVEFLSHLYGGLRGNVDASCVRRWKKRGRFPIGDNWTF